MRRLSCAMLLLMLSACATQVGQPPPAEGQPPVQSQPQPEQQPPVVTKPKPPAPTVNLSGYPPEFRDGYTDGCTSAKPNATRIRDEARIRSDTRYAQGWQDGFDICKRQR